MIQYYGSAIIGIRHSRFLRAHASGNFQRFEEAPEESLVRFDDAFLQRP